MQWWQTLLTLLIGAGGLFFGALIGKPTKKEIQYAERWLVLFTQASALGLLLIALFAYGIGWWVDALFGALFLAYAVHRLRTPKSKRKKLAKRTPLTYAFYAVFGLLYGLVAATPQSESLILLFSTIVFLDSVTIGSLLRVRKKDVGEYVIPFVCYVVVGMLFAIVLRALIVGLLI